MSTYRESTPPQGPVWEYRVIYVGTGSHPGDEQEPLEATCQNMGRRGWELVAVTRSATGTFHHCFFKRLQS